MAQKCWLRLELQQLEILWARIGLSSSTGASGTINDSLLPIHPTILPYTLAIMSSTSGFSAEDQKEMQQFIEAEQAKARVQGSISHFTSLVGIDYCLKKVSAIIVLTFHPLPFLP